MEKAGHNLLEKLEEDDHLLSALINEIDDTEVCVIN